MVRLSHKKCWLMSAVALGAIAIGIVLYMMRAGQDDGEVKVILPITYRLSDEQVSSLESSALSEGSIAAALQLNTYYSIGCMNDSLGVVWLYRAAQLGDFTSACYLSKRGLLNDLPQIFSEEALSNSLVFTMMSDLARQYIRSNYYNCRSGHTSPSTEKVVCAVDDWLLGPAMAITGKVRRGEWGIVYAAYKARNRSGKSRETDQVQVLVFNALPYIGDDGRSAPDTPGSACQEAVFMAESNGLPWIVVFVCFDYIPEELGITDEEKLDCARVALERVFAKFSLPSSTVVMPAGDVNFVKRFTSFIERDYNVKSAPGKLVVHDDVPTQL